MVEITGETIKSAMALNIKQNITLDDGSNFRIYKETTVQGLKKPCFFIWTLDVGQTKQMGNNYERVYQMNIRFHAQDDVDNLYERLCELGNKLLCSLARIYVPINIDEQTVVNKPVIGKQMSFNVVEDVLQVYVTYTIKIKQALEKTPEMTVLGIKNNIKI